MAKNHFIMTIEQRAQVVREKESIVVGKYYP